MANAVILLTSARIYALWWANIKRKTRRASVGLAKRLSWPITLTYLRRNRTPKIICLWTSSSNLCHHPLRTQTRTRQRLTFEKRKRKGSNNVASQIRALLRLLHRRWKVSPPLSIIPLSMWAQTRQRATPIWFSAQDRAYLQIKRATESTARSRKDLTWQLMARTLLLLRFIHSWIKPMSRFLLISKMAVTARAPISIRSRSRHLVTIYIIEWRQRTEQVQISIRVSSTNSILYRRVDKSKNRAKQLHPGTLKIRQTLGQCSSTNPCNWTSHLKAFKSIMGWLNHLANSKSDETVKTPLDLKMHHQEAKSNYLAGFSRCSAIPLPLSNRNWWATMMKEAAPVAIIIISWLAV